MASPLTYIFLGSPELAATILSRLVKEKGAPLLVVTQEAKQAGRGNKMTTTAVEDTALRLNLPLLRTSNVNESSVLAQIQALNPDLFLVAAFGQIFKEPLLAIPKRYCLNVHTSLLPKYRGAAPIQWALYQGDPITGVSIQKMVKKLDAGDILVQKQIGIAPEDTTESLLTKLAELGAEALLEGFQQIESGVERFTPQDETAVSFAPKIDKSHAVIDWKREARAIHNQVRALQPWPVAETKLGSEGLKVYRTRVVPGNPEHPPGTVVTDAKTRLVVQCGDGSALSLEELQLQSRKRLPISQFLAGYRGQFPFSRL